MMYPHTVEIQQKTTTPDGYGGYTETWNTILNYDCEVVPVGGKEYYVAQRLENPIEANINGDYDGSIKPNMRVKFGEILYNIEGVIPSMPDMNGDFELMSLNVSTWGP